MLVDALKNQTYKNYELIVIDDIELTYPHWSRLKLVKDYLEDNKIPVVYVGPSKKPCFPELGYNVVNCWNTGVMLSTGDIVIHINDYQWYYPNSLAKFLRWEDKLRNKTCIVCGGDMYQDYRPKNFRGMLTLWEPPWKGDAISNGCTYSFTWIPEEFETTYTAFPYELLMDMNGYLESCDAYAAEGQFDPIVERLKKVGGKIFVDRDNKMQMINHRDWQPVDMWHQGKRSPQGSITYIPRENCFNLREHKRGDLSRWKR